MFKLNDELPTSIEINGKTYNLEMSFNNIISLNELLNDKDFNWGDQVILGSQMLFDELPSTDIRELEEIFVKAYKEIVSYESEKITYDLKGNPMPSKNKSDNGKPSYDLVQDAEYIYASFFQCYGIDLHEQHWKLHYYKFRALLKGLSDDTIFQKIVQIRTSELPTGKGSQKARKDLEEKKKMYALK